MIPVLGGPECVRARCVEQQQQRIRAAAAVAAANSGPIGTTGIQSGEDWRRPGIDAKAVVFLPPSSAD